MSPSRRLLMGRVKALLNLQEDALAPFVDDKFAQSGGKLLSLSHGPRAPGSRRSTSYIRASPGPGCPLQKANTAEQG
jgi:hypothetical protein